jgi:cell division protein FtsL
MTAPAHHSATAAATAAAPAPRRRDKEEAKRPPLRVVQPGERQRRRRAEEAQAQAKARPRHTRLLVACTVLVVGAALFGLVAAHVMLTQNQFRLQKLERLAADEQARYERLRAHVAELESPARIAAAAQERLGMVPPASVKYLTPVVPPSQAQQQSAGTTPNAAPEDDEHAMTEWSVVKRQLSKRP